MLIMKKKTKRQKCNEETGKKELTEDENKYLEWREKNIIYPAVSLRSLKVTFGMLNKKQKLTPHQQKKRALCRGISPYPTSFDSPLVIFRAIRNCILTRNWNACTQLLLLLLDKDKLYTPYVKNLCELNFQLNPSDSNGAVFKEFLQQVGSMNQSSFRESQ